MSFWLEVTKDQWKRKGDVQGTASWTGIKTHEGDSWGNVCKNIWGLSLNKYSFHL